MNDCGLKSFIPPFFMTTGLSECKYFLQLGVEGALLSRYDLTPFDKQVHIYVRLSDVRKIM